jgi:P27 family predicted phage terminase small subunit
LLEWHRVCDELDAAGKLDKADRAVLTVYCTTWQEHHKASKAVAEYGSVIKYSNGMVGQSPYYKVMRETATLLRGYLADLGLTPATRHKGASAGSTTDDLDF